VTGASLHQRSLPASVQLSFQVSLSQAFLALHTICIHYCSHQACQSRCRSRSCDREREEQSVVDLSAGRSVFRHSPCTMILRTIAPHLRPCSRYRALALSGASLSQSYASRPHLLATYATKTPAHDERTTNNTPEAAPLASSNIPETLTKNSSTPASLAEQSSSPSPNKLADAGPASPTIRENIYTIPNMLTVSRIISCPFLGYFIVNGKFVAATSLLFYAGVSDWVGCICSTS
jgi:hypothetical protein